MTDDLTKDLTTDETLNDPPPGGFRSKEEARTEIARQRAEDAANIAEAARVYQAGGKEALTEWLKEKAKTARPRRPLIARRD
ncbi:MAG: hypothetical protein JMDDDDMK_00746 [Acidobacteria bacterium]|nr:hypothetical protein [Acidobacteriota bacterium]